MGSLDLHVPLALERRLLRNRPRTHLRTGLVSLNSRIRLFDALLISAPEHAAHNFNLRHHPPYIGLLITTGAGIC